MSNVEDTQALAAWQIEQIKRALQRAGWDFVAVSLWRRVDESSVGGSGSSGFCVERVMMPALPGLADNLRVLARELDELHRQSGAPTIIEGYTHVIQSPAHAERTRGDG